MIKKIIILSVFLPFLFINASLATTLTSTVNRNPIKVDQTLVLTVTYTDSARASDLDISGLAQDFEVLANSSGNNNNVIMVNGKTSLEKSTVWNITLAAKREGNLNIPELELNGARSQSITVQARPLTAAELAEPDAIKVSVTIEDRGRTDIKPGEQIIVQVELSADRNVGNIRGQELVVQGADLEPLGQQDGQRIENGITRQVALWRYALFPNEGGEIILPAQRFEGRVGGRRSIFDSFGSGGETVKGTSAPQSIIVSDKPETNGKDWLVASNVTIKSDFTSDITKAKVGEPLTRTITITAADQRASAIPPLTVPTSADYKFYEDQPKLENTPSANGLTGIRTETLAIIPSRPGEITLPEQRINWWDTNSDEWKEAILPAQVITVTGSALSTSQNNDPVQFNGSTTGETSTSRANKNRSDHTDSSDWFWRLTTLLLACVVIIQFLLSHRMPRIINTPRQRQSVEKSERQAWKELNSRFTQQNSKEIRQSLISWTKTILDNPSNGLDSLAHACESDQLTEQLNLLDAQLYGAGENFDSSALQAALSECRDKLKQSNSKANTPPELAPLYPN